MNNQNKQALTVLIYTMLLLLIGLTIYSLTTIKWVPETFKTLDTLCSALIMVLWPLSALISYHCGVKTERNRQRTRITNLITTYQTEPHGIRYSQHRREV